MTIIMSSLSHRTLPLPQGLGKQQQRYGREKSSSSRRQRRAAVSAIKSSSPSSFIPTEVSEFIEPAAIEMARRVQVVEVPVEGREKNVMTSLVQSEKREDASEYHPFVLLHGFDSSCLESVSYTHLTLPTTD